MGTTIIEPLHPVGGNVPGPSPSEIANSILEGGELPLFAREHPSNGMVYVDAGLIAYHYQVSDNRAKQAKNLLSAHVPDAELEEAAGEEWASST